MTTATSYKTCWCTLPYEQCCGAPAVPYIVTDRSDHNSFGYDDNTFVWPPRKENRVRRAVRAFIAAWRQS